MPRIKAKTETTATIGDNSKAIASTVHPAFTAGRNWYNAGAAAADALRLNDAAKQDEAKLQFKMGHVAAKLFGNVETTPELVATVAKLFERGAERNEAEKKALKAAEQRLSRLMTQYDVANLEDRGGANKKVRTAEQLHDIKCKRLLKQVKEVMGDAAVARLEGKVKVATGKTERALVPVFAKEQALKGMQEHFAFMTKALNDSVKRNSPHLTGAWSAKMFKAVSELSKATKAIAALPLKG